ncbi:hypothetical protein AAVH_31515 [Aphelenchoides avenae]|nr:hypothetical protein AAVH_31515 [Aphelenchus avenae]
MHPVSVLFCMLLLQITDVSAWVPVAHHFPGTNQRIQLVRDTRTQILNRPTTTALEAEQIPRRRTTIALEADLREVERHG